jgi:hypothetical protein
VRNVVHSAEAVAMTLLKVAKRKNCSLTRDLSHHGYGFRSLVTVYAELSPTYLANSSRTDNGTWIYSALLLLLLSPVINRLNLERSIALRFLQRSIGHSFQDFKKSPSIVHVISV